MAKGKNLPVKRPAFVAGDHHKKLVDMVQGLDPQVVYTSKFLVDLYKSKYTDSIVALPSDHCTNWSNKGACRCAGTDQAVFIKDLTKKGLYKVNPAVLQSQQVVNQAVPAQVVGQVTQVPSIEQVAAPSIDIQQGDSNGAIDSYEE
jgi:hypothetical protein